MSTPSRHTRTNKQRQRPDCVACTLLIKRFQHQVRLTGMRVVMAGGHRSDLIQQVCGLNKANPEPKLRKANRRRSDATVALSFVKFYTAAFAGYPTGARSIGEKSNVKTGHRPKP